MKNYQQLSLAWLF